MDLTLLHFNDLHGRLDQLPRLFTLIQRERRAAQAAGRQVLLLDGGDSSDRQQWASAVTQGRANFSLLEAMGVQASVVGNAESLIWGRAALAKLVAAVNFPVLAANLVDAADPTQLAVPGLARTALFDLAGFTVGVAGLTQTFPAEFAEAGYGVVDTEATLRREIESLRGQGAKLIVLLSHLGLTRTPAGAASEAPNAWHDDDVAAAFPEIGVIVGGHTHSVLAAPQVVGGTVIVQAGCFGEYLGRLDLTVDDATPTRLGQAGGVLAHSGRLIACDQSVPRDPTIQGTLELVLEEAERVRSGGRPFATK
jgi:5'-nucleotidase